MNTPEPHSRLEHFPVTFFGMVMGLIGLTHVILFWALSFPMTAITIASFRFAALTGSGAHLVIGSVLLLAVVLIIAMLLWRTARAMRAGEICVPE